GTESGGTVTWDLGCIAAATSTSVELAVAVDAGLTANLSNTASVTTTTNDPIATNASATETTAVQVSADLSIVKTDLADPVTAGDDLTYELAVTNNGPADATGVQTSDTLPAGTTLVSATGGGTESGGTVTWDLGSVVNGTTTTVQITVNVNPGRTADLSNTASVTSTTTDPNAAND